MFYCSVFFTVSYIFVYVGWYVLIPEDVISWKCVFMSDCISDRKPPELTADWGWSCLMDSSSSCCASKMAFCSFILNPCFTLGVFTFLISPAKYLANVRSSSSSCAAVCGTCDGGVLLDRLVFKLDKTETASAITTAGPDSLRLFGVIFVSEGVCLPDEASSDKLSSSGSLSSSLVSSSWELMSWNAKIKCDYLL